MRKINHCSSIIRKFTRKLLPCLLISLFLLFNFLFLPLAPAAANQDVVFKDANFKAAVLQMLRNQDILTELDTEISKERAANLTKLTLENVNIASLEDIVNFPSLRILQIKESRISDLSPLQKLNFLRSLNIQKSQISNLQPLKTVDSLTYLNLSHNQISDLTPLAQLTSLTELYLADNKITDIAALANLEELTELNLAGNNLSDLTPLAAITANLGSLILNNNNWTYKAEKREIDLPFKVKNGDQIKLSIAAAEAADKDKVEITGTKIKLLNLQGKTSLKLQYTSTIGGWENYRKKQEFTYQGTITLDVTAIKTVRKYAADPQMPFGQMRSEFDEYGNEIVYKGTASVSSEITVPHVTLPDKENFIVKKGRDGKKQRIKTYTVNPLNGDITETVSEKEIVSAVDDTYEKKEMATPDTQANPQPNNPQPGTPQPDQSDSSATQSNNQPATPDTQANPQPNNPQPGAPQPDQSDSSATQSNNPPATPDTQANPQPNQQPNQQPNKQQAGTQKTNQSTSPAAADQANLDVPKKSEQQIISSPSAYSWQPKRKLPANPVGKSGEKQQTGTAAGLTILISVLGILIAAGKLPIVRRKC